MSGHSKWSTIKRKKGATDAARGKLFTKHARLIQIAAREGKSGDVELNAQLAAAVDAAKADSVPKENIERAIAKGTGTDGGEAMTERIYEAYAPGGVALIIVALTDNVNRTIAEVRHALSKNGGKIAESGSVIFQFEKRGVLSVPLGSAHADDAELAAIDAGAVDVAIEDDIMHIETAANELMAARHKLVDAGFTVQSAELSFVPQSTVELADADVEKVMTIIEALEELDDVSEVVANMA